MFDLVSSFLHSLYYTTYDSYPAFVYTHNTTYPYPYPYYR